MDDFARRCRVCLVLVNDGEWGRIFARRTHSICDRCSRAEDAEVRARQAARRAARPRWHPLYGPDRDLEAERLEAADELRRQLGWWE